MPPDLLIVGASTRAAAFSAVRGGMTVAAADLFADRDLAAVADATAISDWPAGIERWAETFERSVPLVFVGALENEPELLERLAAKRPVLGPVGQTLRRPRSPENLADLFDRRSIPRPALWNETCREQRGFPEQRDTIESNVHAVACHPESTSHRHWLLKPRRSAAGRGIRRWSAAEPPPGNESFVQEFIDGRVGSAAYLADDEGVELLGVTELLLPRASSSVILSPFAYCGSITADAADPTALQRLGRCLAETGLRGLFGVDFVLRSTDEGCDYVPIEVNPRYTAGMEVLERRDGRSFVADHVALLTDTKIPQASTTSRSLPRCHGKRIVYAGARCRVPELLPPNAGEVFRPDGAFEFADIPHPGTIFPAGAPICTVLATAPDRAACIELLEKRETAVIARLEPA